jgi:hypothetical protein
MPVKLMPPGNISNSQQVVVNTGASTTMSGSSGTGQQTSTPSTSDDVVLAIDNLRVMLEHKEQYDVIPNTVHAPDYNVTDAMFVDSDVRLFAHNIALSGTLLVRKNGFAQVFSSLEVNGIVDNFSVLEIGVGDVM